MVHFTFAKSVYTAFKGIISGLASVLIFTHCRLKFEKTYTSIQTLKINSNHKYTQNWLKVRDGHEIKRLSKSLTVYYPTILNEKKEEVTQLSVYFFRSLRNILITCSATSRGCVITHCDVIMTYTVCVSCVSFLAFAVLPGRCNLFHFSKV